MTERRVLVGGVGYRHLRDHSVGVVATDHLSLRSWPHTIEIDDLSFNPVALSQRLQDEAANHSVDCLILVAAVARGREPGTVTAYRWDGVLPDSDTVQSAVVEAVTGVIAVDNTLLVLRQFGGLPDVVLVVEIEPEVEEFGESFSPAVQAQFDDLCNLVTALATDSASVDALRVLPLGGEAVPGLQLE